MFTTFTLAEIISLVKGGHVEHLNAMFNMQLSRLIIL